MKDNNSRALIWSCIVGVLIIAGLFLMAFREAWKKMVTIGCRHQMSLIGLDCRIYAQEHNGHFPSSWLELNRVGERAQWGKLFRCPSPDRDVGDWSQVDLWSDYRLLPGRTTNDPPTTVLAIEPRANHKTGANVLFVDGSTEWWPASRLLQDKRSHE